ncbi:contact-dependent growth inhibition system immunity protein [Bradyrhizobium sp. Pha-3]|uniref:contact-dependent growth inhibition system immunity protein n=1 Tax=Bradyrhizobium sp. Pha-3 TaxID=208375 RepID=UPI0035D512B6
MVDERRTLQELDGQDWGEPETAPTGMVARCLRLRRTPLKNLSAGDVRLLIGQKIGLPVLIPMAFRYLRADPLVESEYFPGDLLRSLLSVERAYWSDNPVEFEQLIAIARSVAAADGKVANECRTFLAASDCP